MAEFSERQTPDLRNGEPYPHRKFFWGYEIDHPLSVTEIALLSERTGVRYLYRYFDKHEYTLGSTSTPEAALDGRSVANEAIRRVLADDFLGRPVVSATRGMYREEGRMLVPKEGIQFVLYALEMNDELDDLDVSAWDEQRQAIADVVAELGGREISLDEIGI